MMEVSEVSEVSDGKRWGFTLIELLIAIVLFAIATVGVSQLFRNFFRVSEFVAQKKNLLQLQMQLLANLDCPATRIANTCTATVSLVNRDNVPFVLADESTRIFNIPVRAVCVGQSVFVEIQTKGSAAWQSISSDGIPFCVLGL